jgi:hypothetical protein
VLLRLQLAVVMVVQVETMLDQEQCKAVDLVDLVVVLRAIFPLVLHLVLERLAKVVQVVQQILVVNHTTAAAEVVLVSLEVVAQIPTMVVRVILQAYRDHLLPMLEVEVEVHTVLLVVAVERVVAGMVVITIQELLELQTLVAVVAVAVTHQVEAAAVQAS